MAYHCGVHGTKFISRILLFFIATFGLAKADAADWPHFLGPTADGISTETGLISAWPSGGAKVLWKKQIGTGYSAPAIRDGRLVLFHRVKNEEIVQAYDVKTAKPVWQLWLWRTRRGGDDGLERCPNKFFEGLTSRRLQPWSTRWMRRRCD